MTWPLKTTIFTAFQKYTTVFGIKVFADATVTDAQFQHLASVTAEWLDNDQDGCVDNPLVLAKLLAASPQPVVLSPGATDKPDSVTQAFDTAGYFTSAPVYTAEILPNCAGALATSECADASLEEILHIITSHGYSPAYPAAFSEVQSKLTVAMDVARGGKFTTPPATYPTGAWYTYDDTTCGYSCMVTEYIYWGISAWSGALVGRGTDREWRFDTRAKLEAGDLLLTALIKNTTVYKVPGVAPTGVYKGPATCSTGANHS